MGRSTRILKSFDTLPELLSINKFLKMWRIQQVPAFYNPDQLNTVITPDRDAEDQSIEGDSNLNTYVEYVGWYGIHELIQIIKLNDKCSPAGDNIGFLVVDESYSGGASCIIVRINGDVNSTYQITIDDLDTDGSNRICTYTYTVNNHKINSLTNSFNNSTLTFRDTLSPLPRETLTAFELLASNFTNGSD
jgi:hypothetical protein